MLKNRVKKSDDKQSLNGDVVEATSPRVYEKPVLIAYGDVRDITLGPTNGEGESGAALFFRVPPP